MVEVLTRSVIAEKLGVHPETLRYYEAQKLIDKPARLSNGYRVYQEKDLKKMQFILMAKKLGFSLKEIKDLLKITETENLNKKEHREKVRGVAELKSSEIHEKINLLKQMKKSLDELILQCEQKKELEDCPIISCLKNIS